MSHAEITGIIGGAISIGIGALVIMFPRFLRFYIGGLLIVLGIMTVIAAIAAG